MAEPLGAYEARSRPIARIVATIVAGLTLLVFAAPSASAGVTTAAQTGDCAGGGDYPPTTAPTATESIELVSAQLAPGTDGSVVLAGARGGGEYSGTIYSTPIPLPATTAAADGGLTFAGFAVPADFETGVEHTIELCSDGSLVLSASFCVTASGSIGTDCDEVVPGGAVATPSSPRADTASAGSLAFTGNEIWTLVRIALVAIALGVLAVYVRRRRELQAVSR